MIYVLYFTSQGAPKTGLTPTIITLNKISDGAAVPVTPSAWPTVSEIAGGLYKFTLAFPFNSLSEALGVVVDGGTALVNTERYKVMQLTVNDGSLDAAVSTRAPEAAGNVAAIKADVDTLLTRITAAVMLAGSYVAPDNADIGTILTAIQNGTYGLNALLTAIGSGGITAQQIWEYATRTITEGTKDSQIDAIKAITDQIKFTVPGQVDSFVVIRLGFSVYHS